MNTEPNVQHLPNRGRPQAQRRALRAAVIGLVLLAGCGTQRTPNSYTGSVQKNFVNSCVAQSKNSLRNAPKTCQCTYTKIKASLKFSEFKKINSDLTARPGPIPARLATIIDDCKAQNGESATSASSTSRSTTSTGSTTSALRTTTSGPKATTTTVG